MNALATFPHPAPQFRHDRRLPLGRNALQPWEHVVSVSGGKDSTALYLLAMERGMPFTAVMADTGHEHEATMDYVAELPGRTGGPPIAIVRADFTLAMARKRAFVLAHWERRGVPAAHVERAAKILATPTGIPFLDLCMVKGRFPGAKSRFCTDELKLVPMWRGIQKPLLDDGRAMISWQGVRAEESLPRRFLPRWQRIMSPAPYCLRKSEREAAVTAGYRVYAYRPIHAWLKGDVFAMHARHGLAPNPLYGWGAERVGCWPCIFAGKDELRVLARIAPEAIEKLEEWEAIVSEVSKRMNATFFCASDDPLYEEGDDWSAYGIRARIEWSKTTRGGRQYDLLAQSEARGSCSEIGACE